MVMASDLVVGLAIGLLMGFALGYGVRSFISYRRHQRGRRRRHTLG
jgi:NhaP-type Na+/H+ or K+/H+ antiporter